MAAMWGAIIRLEFGTQKAFSVSCFPDLASPALPSAVPRFPMAFPSCRWLDGRVSVRDDWGG